MADDLDRAADIEEAHRQANIAASRGKPFNPGKPGDCEHCGDYFVRLVGGACGFCRDKLKLP